MSERKKFLNLLIEVTQVAPGVFRAFDPKKDRIALGTTPNEAVERLKPGWKSKPPKEGFGTGKIIEGEFMRNQL